MVLLAVCSLLLLLPFGMAARSARAPDVPEYFPEIEGDLSNVTWSHATNSLAKLAAAIEDPGMMMLEADVLLGIVIGGGPEKIPIMAHPPDTESDLSLQIFLDEVILANANGKRKGIKLDFKSLEVVPIALEMLGSLSNQMGFPAWLNADIQQGPVNSTRIPIDANQFLRECKLNFPESTLSVGWTTRYGIDTFPPIVSGEYSMEMADAMIKALSDNQIIQPVTFPVRASLTAHSEKVILRLLSEVQYSTLTLWGPETDYVDVPALIQVVQSVGRKRVYMDIPEKLKNQIVNAVDPAKSSGQRGTLLSKVMTVALSLFAVL
ncbi:protein FAM151B isoform X2 [Neocloeon triangulifer]|nr:protein FAM151B isoform X2 [Neocloeon triangulifer]XP_059468400.1 protein FAM151B isoform X2 [Neocloeon triangulifer]